MTHDKITPKIHTWIFLIAVNSKVFTLYVQLYYPSIICCCAQLLHCLCTNVTRAVLFIYCTSGIKWFWSAVSSVCLKSNLFCTTGEQLQINQPNVYDCDVPESLASLVPALAAVCEKKHPSGHIFPHIKTVSNRSVTLTSKDGTDFISFAKGASFDNGTTLEK